jgi:hypothetical protein
MVGEPKAQANPSYAFPHNVRATNPKSVCWPCIFMGSDFPLWQPGLPKCVHWVCFGLLEVSTGVRGSLLLSPTLELIIHTGDDPLLCNTSFQIEFARQCVVGNEKELVIMRSGPEDSRKRWKLRDGLIEIWGHTAIWITSHLKWLLKWGVVHFEFPWCLSLEDTITRYFDKNRHSGGMVCRFFLQIVNDFLIPRDTRVQTLSRF